MRWTAALFCAAALWGQTKLVSVDVAGYRKVLDASKGKVVLVDIWAIRCPPCRVEMPQLVALASRLREKQFQLITIAVNEPHQAAAAKFVASMKVPGPAYIHRPTPNEKRVFHNVVDANWTGALPALFLYDKNGAKVKSFVGATPVSEIESAIARLL